MGEWLQMVVDFFYALRPPPQQPGMSEQDRQCRHKHHTWELNWTILSCQMDLQRIVLLFLYQMNREGCHQNQRQLHRQQCEIGKLDQHYNCINVLYD